MSDYQDWKQRAEAAEARERAKDETLRDLIDTIDNLLPHADDDTSNRKVEVSEGDLAVIHKTAARAALAQQPADQPARESGTSCWPVEQTTFRSSSSWMIATGLEFRPTLFCSESPGEWTYMATLPEPHELMDLLRNNGYALGENYSRAAAIRNLRGDT